MRSPFKDQLIAAEEKKMQEEGEQLKTLEAKRGKLNFA